MTYGPILANVAVKTFKYVVADYVVDHYAAVGPDDAQPALARMNTTPRSQQASKVLLLELAL